MVAELSLRLDGGPGAPAEARRALGRFDPALAPELMETVTLLASELVANAVVHGHGDHVDLDVGLRPAKVRVEVGNDSSASEVVRRSPEPGRAGGWGLYMVDELASRWGVVEGPVTRVWFEIDR